MIHHPIILVPKLVVLAIIAVTLIFLRGILPPDQFRIAVIAAVVFFVCFTVVLWVFTARVLRDPNSRLGKAMILSHEARSQDGFTASSNQFVSLTGKQGVAISNLNPAGTVLVEEKRISVMTDGEFIEADSPVEVVSAKGTKVIVTKTKGG